MTPTAVLLAALAASSSAAPADPNAPPDVPVAQYPEPAPAPPDGPAIDAEAAPVVAPRLLRTMSGFDPAEQAKISAWRRDPEAPAVIVDDAAVDRGHHRFHFTPDLQVRTRVGAVSEFTLDRDGNQIGEGLEVGGRVRWRPVFGFGVREQLRVVGMLDVANGQWAPRGSNDPVVQDIIDNGQPPIPTDFRTVDPRELYLEWTTRVGQLRLGQMSFSWGLGLVANDGNNMDRFGDMKFGNDGDGSIQERILFGTKPFAGLGGAGRDVIVAVGADLVFRDPNADLIEGDRAGQGIAVVRWQPEHKPGSWVGAYGAYRRQRSADDGDSYADDDDLEVGVIDFAGQGWLDPRPNLSVIGAFETAMIMGHTTFARGDFEQHRVLQAAAAVRAYIGNPTTWLVGFDGGAFSGDANPDDDQLNGFAAAPGYTAGLVLFQYYQGWQSARSQRLAEDTGLVGVPSNGTQYIPTEGSVTNTVYWHPKARYSLLERFELWGGPLMAAAAVPVADPFATRLSGGDPTNPLGGQPDRRYLGTELDLGIRGRYELRDVWFQFGLQGGLLFPGVALIDASDAHDAPIWAGWARAELRY
jgi:hypothetical protein